MDEKRRNFLPVGEVRDVVANKSPGILGEIGGMPMLVQCPEHCLGIHCGAAEEIPSLDDGLPCRLGTIIIRNAGVVFIGAADFNADLIPAASLAHADQGIGLMLLQ